jgi:hypothetical protein
VKENARRGGHRKTSSRGPSAPCFKTSLVRRATLVTGTTELRGFLQKERMIARVLAAEELGAGG